MRGYLGQVYRSRSKVKGQGYAVKKFHWDVLLSSESLFIGPAKEGIRLRNTTGRNTMHGVFKVYAVSFWWKYH